MQQQWGFRAARTVMFTGVCVLLAVLGHVVMSAAAVPWWAIVPASASIAAAAWILADRERSVPFVVVGTIVAQAELHTVFTLAQSLQPTAMHHHHMAGPSSVGMLAAHLIAALLCGLWLAYGENAAFAVLRTIADRILFLLRPWRSAPAWPRLRPAVSTAPPPRQYLLADAITSRGPPRGTAVA
ncbi:hypothetical protein [Kribbella italica]|uniref:Uncharacterized protein n=1 Tax=Kribbella italica TaxID=1540520 RepID=A0A7W9J5R4_9ACTN|nr:hypothetical protein [Kribbella italica]MBB5835602.1 hypothetical protein [Kribbella italica]